MTVKFIKLMSFDFIIYNLMPLPLPAYCKFKSEMMALNSKTGVFGSSVLPRTYRFLEYKQMDRLNFKTA